jgi:hypothetical protein
MDVQYPYADGAARQRLLYRLPPVPSPRRLLLVFVEREDKAIAREWEGPVSAIDSTKLIGFAKRHEGQFDAVALPRVLGRPVAETRKLLAAAHQLLAPQGTVIGHVDHLFALRRLATPSGLGRWLRSTTGRAGIGTAGRCLDELRGSGFEAAECYYVHPHINSPMSLIPCHHGTPRRQMMRAIRTSPNQYGRLSYAARLLAASVGVGSLQQPHLFFWASKPC